MGKTVQKISLSMREWWGKTSEVAYRLKRIATKWHFLSWPDSTCSLWAFRYNVIWGNFASKLVLFYLKVVSTCQVKKLSLLTSREKWLPIPSLAPNQESSNRQKLIMLLILSPTNTKLYESAISTPSGIS